MYDLAIIGGGPAGVSAGVYASRKKLKTIFITKDFGGQSIVSDGIENWIGDISIPGPELAKKLEDHLMAYAEDIVDVKKGQLGTKVEKLDENKGYKVITDKGEEFETKAVLIATGSHRRQLPAEGAERLEHKGLTYCASCDGPLFTDKDVVVVGGGNAGFETAAQLLAYTKSVTLLDRGPEFRADPVTVEAVSKDPKFTSHHFATVKEVLGEKFLDGLIWTDSETNEDHKLDVQGVFVEIGNIPTTEMVKDVVDLDDYNRIVIDPWTQKTSEEGIWAAGDCTNAKYHQNNIAAGHGVVALEDIYVWLKAR
jgi:alkyl hydroperoxide reductase subunit F